MSELSELRAQLKRHEQELRDLTRDPSMPRGLYVKMLPGIIEGLKNRINALRSGAQ